MKDKIFFAVCLGFALGVLLRSFLFVNFYFAIFILALSIAVLLLAYFTKVKWALVGSVFVFVLAVGILRFHIADRGVSPAPEGELTGIIVEEPDMRENNQKLTVKLSDGNKILVTTNFGNDFKYGDELSLSGALKMPENFTTDQGKVFDYINYLRKDGIFYLMSYPEIDILSRGHGNAIRGFLFGAKEKLLDKMNLAILPPESTLMGGLILGERSSFSEEMRQNLVATGTIHIVALSGYNVSIVADWIGKVFYFLPRNLGIGLGIFAIILFVLMTGASSTAIRAGIMGALALIARATGRNYDVARALILAGITMVLWNPFVLVYDVSFQLSFLATVAIIFFVPKIERYFLWVPEKGKLREIISVTAGVYLFVLPFILYKMGNLSLVALPANILILLFIPLTMGLGFFTSLLGLIFYPLSVPLGFIATLFLKYELGVVNFFANMPFASLAIPNFPLVLTLLIYAWFAYKLFGRSIRRAFFNAEAPQNSSLSLPN